MTQRNPNPNPDELLPPWLRGMDEEVAPIKDVGTFSNFLSTADALPETIDTEMTYDQWMAIQKEAKREKSIEEELPEFDFNAFGADAEASVSTGRLGTGSLGTGSPGTGNLGTGPLGATGELPDWYLGLEELDESDAPEWFTASGVSPFVDTNQLSGLVPSPTQPPVPPAQPPPAAPPSAPRPRPISASTSAPPPPAVQPPPNRPNIAALPPWMQDMMADDSPETSAPAQPEPAAPNAIDSMFGEMNLSQGSFGTGFEDTFSGGTAEPYAGEAESDDFYATFGGTETQDEGLDDFFSTFSSPGNAPTASPPSPAPPPQRTGTPSLQSRLAPAPTNASADEDELPDFALLQGSGRSGAPAFADEPIGTRPLSPDEISGATGFTDFGTRQLSPEELGYSDFDEIGTRQLTQEELGYSDFGEAFGTRQFSQEELQDVGATVTTTSAGGTLYDTFDPFALDFEQNASATAEPSAYVPPDAHVEEPDLDMFLNQRAAPPPSSVRALDIPDPVPASDEFDRFAPPPPANDTGELNWLSELGGIISAVTDNEESRPPRPGTGSLGFDPYTDLRSSATSTSSTGSLKRTGGTTASTGDDPFAGGDFDWNTVVAVDPNASQSTGRSTGSARPDSGTLRDGPDWLSSLGDVSEIADVSAQPETTASADTGWSSDAPATPAPTPGSAPGVPGKSMLSRRLGNAAVSQEVPAAKPAAPAAQPTSPPVNMTSPFSDFFEDVDPAPTDDAQRTIAFSADLLAMDQQAGRPENRQADQFDSLDFNLFEDDGAAQFDGSGSAGARPAAPLNTDALFGGITFDDVIASGSAGVADSAFAAPEADDLAEDGYGGINWDDAPLVSNPRRAPAENPVAVTSTDQLSDLISSLNVAPVDDATDSPSANAPVEMEHGDDLLDSAWMLEDLYSNPTASPATATSEQTADADAALDLYADLYSDSPAFEPPPAGRASGYLVPPDDVALYGETGSEENDNFALPDLPDMGAALPDFVAEGSADNATSDVGDLGSMDWLTDNLFEDNTRAGTSPAPAAYPDADITQSAGSFTPDLADDTGANWDSMLNALNALDAGRDAAADKFTDTFADTFPDTFSNNRSDVNDSDPDSMNVGSDFSPYALYAEDARITPSPDGDDDPYLSLYSTTQTPDAADLTQAFIAFNPEATEYEWGAFAQFDVPQSDVKQAGSGSPGSDTPNTDNAMPNWMNELAAVSPARGTDAGADTIQVDTDALNALFGAQAEDNRAAGWEVASGGESHASAATGAEDGSWLADLNLDLDTPGSTATYQNSSAPNTFNANESGSDFDIDALIGSTAETPDLFAPGVQPSLANRLQSTSPVETPPSAADAFAYAADYTPDYASEFSPTEGGQAGDFDNAPERGDALTSHDAPANSLHTAYAETDEYDESRPKTDRLRFSRSWTSFLTSLSDEEDDLVKDADE